MILKSLYPYIAGALLLTMVGTHTWAYVSGRGAGKEAGEREVASQIASVYEAELAASKAEIALSRELNADLLRKLDNLPTATTIREVIRANPTDCPVPQPVSDSLRDQARSANSLRSTR